MQMTQFFSHTALSLPLRRQPSQDVRDLLSNAFSAHDAVIGTCQAPKSDSVITEVVAQRGLIRAFGESIIKALDAHLEGRVDHAYSQMVAGLQSIRPFLQRTNTLAVSKIDPLFRARVFDAPFDVAPDEMLHIPFNKRHLVATQRYSIPGVPMLYLGSSSFGCWAELGRPSLDKMVANCWEVTPSISVLNLAFTPISLAGFAAPDPISKANEHEFFVAQAVIWPLLAAVSIQAPLVERKVPFRTEYLVPQLLLRWVVEDFKCDAIRYFSTLLHPETDAQISANWVFPVKSQARTGHCPGLLGMFKRSTPLSWTAAQVAGLPQSGPVATGNIAIQDEVTVRYQSTTFATYDGRLLGLTRT